VDADYIIYRGEGHTQHTSFKTIIYLPGTGYIQYNEVQNDCTLPYLLNHLPSDFQIVVATYPLSPENKFPAPTLHLQKTISWLIENPDKYLIDPNNIIMSGYSCGGTILIPLGVYFANKSYFFKSLLGLAPVFDYSGDLQKN
jgi:acetyl esterase/lipase